MSYKDKFTIVPAVYVLLKRGDSILLLRRANTGYFDGHYALPAGHIDGGEPAHVAGVREVLEEIGVRVRPEDLRFVHVTHRVAEEGNHERVDFFFEADKWEGEPQNMEPQKCDDLQWFQLDALPENVTPLTLQVLEAAKAGEYYSFNNFT